MDGGEIKRLKSELQAASTRIVELTTQIENAPVQYITRAADNGLARMREAMRKTVLQYPAAGTWVKFIEDTYTQILAGEK